MYVVITLRNLPSDTLQVCEEAAFPVCPNTFEPDGITESRCRCTDRSEIVIAGVLHGVTTDSFWDIVFEQAAQAADDLGITLRLDRLEPQPSDEVWHAKMANKMISYCREVNSIYALNWLSVDFFSQLLPVSCYAHVLMDTFIDLIIFLIFFLSLFFRRALTACSSQFQATVLLLPSRSAKH